MSITKSFNKHNGTYYAYETTYVWDEACQKKIQKKQCIGKFDPETNEIIPNGKRGRPSKVFAKAAVSNPPSSVQGTETNNLIMPIIENLSLRLINVENSLISLSSEIHSLNAEIASLQARIQQEK